MKRKRSGPRQPPDDKHPRQLLEDKQLPKYSIAVASDLSGVPQQQLRRMEESGLLSPSRTAGNTRRYSDADLTQIVEVAGLADAGINAAGIHIILSLHAQVEALRTEVGALRTQLAQRQPPG